MQSDLITIILVTSAICVYVLLFAWLALNAKEKLVEKVDNYLGSDAPDCMKEQAFFVFESCSDAFMLHRVVLSILFNGKERLDSEEDQSRRREFLRESSMLTSENRKYHKTLMEELFRVMVIRSPIFSLILALVTALLAVLGFILFKSFDKTTDNLRDGIRKSFYPH